MAKPTRSAQPQQPKAAVPTRAQAAPTAKAKASTPSVLAQRNDTLVFGRETYKWMLIGLGIMAIGFICMSGGAMPSPEQMQKMMAVYKAWMEKFKDDIVDMGDKLKPEGRLLTASGLADGPFVELKEVIGGYMILTAESYERVAEIIRECPMMIGPGITLEIRELSGAKM